jgi:acetate kinase
VVNAGSSSVKLSLLGDRDETLAERELSAPRATFDPRELQSALTDELADADAVGHRIVHGGERFRHAVLLERHVEVALRELADLAPLHQPMSLAALDAVSAALPALPAVACFDTAFHATMPEAATTYAIPERWRRQWAVRRYGFHGLSHAWVAHRAPRMLGRSDGQLRIVSCHLGAGASLCAIADGRSLDTTMGFTPLEGLVMATRSGSVDPGLLLWLLERSKLAENELAEVLEYDSGLLALAGTTDMREVLARKRDHDQIAELTLQIYVHRLRAGIAAMAAALGGIDALVFTGGVGEHEAEIRALAVERLAFLGVAIDERRNRQAGPDADLTAGGAGASTLLVRAREDIEIARQTRNVLA